MCGSPIVIFSKSALDEQKRSCNETGRVAVKRCVVVTRSSVPGCKEKGYNHRLKDQ